MKKIFIFSLLLGTLLSLAVAPAGAEDKDTATALSELKTELQQKGVSQEEVKSIEQPLKNMLNKGANKNDLKNTVTDLSNSGLKGNDLKTSVNSMNDLVNSGETPKEAGNVVSQAAHQAQAQGLKGKDLAAKVQEAIKQRKIAKQQTKQQMKEQKETQHKMMKEQKEKTEKGQGMGMGQQKGHMGGKGKNK